MVISLLSFSKGCGDSRELTKIKNEVKLIREYLHKTRVDKELQNHGLGIRKRNDTATSRTLLDVRRQTEIEEEIKNIEKSRK